MIAVPDGLELAPYEPRLKDGIACLQQRLWSGDPALNARFFDWRYGNAGPGGDSLVFLLLKDGVPIAMRALHAASWRAGAGTPSRTVFLADDLVIAREFEGQGLFAVLTAAVRAELATRGHDCFLSLSALRATTHQSLKAGALQVGPLQPLGRLRTAARWLDAVRDIAAKSPLLWRVSSRAGAWERAAAFFERLDAARASTRGARSGADILVESRLPATALGEFVAALPTDDRIRRVRDARYFAWRFANPLHEYRCVRAERHGRLCGYLIIERALSDLANPRRCHIADWEADSPEVSDDLLRFVLEVGRPVELVAWRESGDSAQRHALEASGFWPIDAEQTRRGLPSILVWPVDPEVDSQRLCLGRRSLLDLANWDLRLADTSYA